MSKGSIKHQIVIIGGGTAGITTAARLRNKSKSLDIAIIDPAERHYYQPFWTLVGAGISTVENTAKDMSSLIPKGVTWIKKAVDAFDPDNNKIKTVDGTEITYDYLVIAPGIQINWHMIKGLKETIGKNHVTSNYSKDYAEYTWQCQNEIKQKGSGICLFTLPNTPVKCAGAPQKVMYLAEDFFRRAGLRDTVEIHFCTSAQKIFGIPKYAEALTKQVTTRGIIPHFHHNLIEVDGPNKIAKFQHLETGETIEMKFDLLHVAPPMSAPDFIQKSIVSTDSPETGSVQSSCGIANPDGWVDVEKYTLQHNVYKNIFSLGDASSLPTSRTGAAIRKQAPVLVENLLAAMNDKPLTAKYDGYTSCPLVMSYGTLILAEFDYDGNPAETFPFDQAKPRWSMYLLKKYILPVLYWFGMLKGRA